MGTTPIPAKKNSKPSSRKIFRLFLILLIVCIVLGYIFSARQFAEMHTSAMQNQQNVSISTARGEPLAIDIQLGYSGDGAWASPTGVQLALAGLSTPLQIVGPSQPDWGDTYTISSQPTPIEVQGLVTIPVSLDSPVERQLSGRITGTILTPGPTGNGSEDLLISVQIHLLSAESFFWSGGQALFDGFAALTFLLLICWLVWGIRGWLRSRRKQGSQPEMPSTGRKENRQGRVILFIFLVAIPVFAASLILYGAIGGGTQALSGGFPEINTGYWLFLALLALSILVQVIASFDRIINWSTSGVSVR